MQRQPLSGHRLQSSALIVTWQPNGASLIDLTFHSAVSFPVPPSLSHLALFKRRHLADCTSAADLCTVILKNLMYATADVTFLFFIGERRPTGRPADCYRPRRNDTAAVYKPVPWQESTLMRPEASLSSVRIGPFGQHVCCQREVGEERCV